MVSFKEVMTTLDTLIPIERNRLIQAYTRMHYAKLYRASKAARGKTLSHWQATVTSLQLKYPDLNVTEPGFQTELEHRAHQWWTVKGTKGKGVDW